MAHSKNNAAQAAGLLFQFGAGAPDKPGVFGFGALVAVVAVFQQAVALLPRPFFQSGGVRERYPLFALRDFGDFSKFFVPAFIFPGLFVLLYIAFFIDPRLKSGDKQAFHAI